MDTRASTIMRGLMDEVVHGPVYKPLLAAFKRHAAALTEQAAAAHTVPPLPGYLPVRTVVTCLETEPRVLIPRAQTMGIISMCDCYDPTGKLIQYEPFAEYVSDIVSLMRSDEGVETRTQVLKPLSRPLSRPLSDNYLGPYLITI